MEKFRAFLKKKEIEISAKRYFIDAMGSMALALFATLLMSSILGTLGDLIFGKASQNDFLTVIAGYAKGATGMAIGCAIAHNLKAPPLVLFSCTVVGSMSYAMGAVVDGVSYAAGPAGVFFVAIVAAEFGKLVSKQTKVDILVTPLTVLFVGYGASLLLCPLVAWLMYWIGWFIGVATAFIPLLMGVVIAMVMGVILTLPISSAAICSVIFSLEMVNLNPESMLLAGGAAMVGCCAQMVGFAVTSFRENGWGGLVAQGIGTSMLQMGNIYKNPKIWLAPTLSGGICGALSTTVFKLPCMGLASGMGTCGLVGPIGAFTSTEEHGPLFWAGLVLLCFVLPGVLSFLFDLVFRRLGWVKEGDQKLDL